MHPFYCTVAAPSLSLRFRSSRAVDLIEEAWNSTLLQKRYARLVAGTDFALSISGTIPRSAFLDAGRARQVVGNIVGNAIKFTCHDEHSDATAGAPAGASVGSPVTSERGSVSLEATFVEEERLLSIAVQDTGRGISAEGLERLFKP